MGIVCPPLFISFYCGRHPLYNKIILLLISLADFFFKLVQVWAGFRGHVEDFSRSE